MIGPRPKAAELGFRDIELGQTFEIERTFIAEDVERFAAVSGDWSPLHVDPGYAAATEFGGCVVHGILLASLFSQLVGMHIPGKHALYLGQDLSFRKPVLVGERVRALIKLIGKSEPTRSLILAAEIRNSEDKVVVSGTARVKVRDTEPAVLPSSAPGESPATAADSSVALVTGASRGIGAEIAATLAARGARVVVDYYRSAAR